MVRLKDTWSFTIPYIVGSKEFSKCLYDIGASINLMPLSLFKELNLKDAININMSLMLVDHSIKKPFGVIEDVLIKVDKIIFPVDFVILDLDQDRNCPLILGRPFLNTKKSLINVNKGKITLQVGK